MLKRLPSVSALILVIVGLLPTTASAQVFLATRVNPQFAIGPLFVRATVTPALGPVMVDVLWSLAIPPTRSALGLEQDLYLLWPGPVRGDAAAAPATSDRQLAQYFTTRGFVVVSEGSLTLLEEELYPPPGGSSTGRVQGRAPFVTFSRQGLKPLGVASVASYIRIPWTPTLTNRTRLLKLRMVLDDLVKPRPASWFENVLWGRRYLLSIGFNDVRDQTIFPVYLENRARVVRLADEPSQLLVSFTDPDRLRIDEIFPQSGGRRPGESREPTEVVSLFLDASEGIAPQMLTVRFGYFSGLQSWGPILIPVLFFVLGRATGPLIERLARRLGRSVVGHVHFGRQGAAARGTEEGVILSRETLGRISPGRTTHDEVLALCGREVLEEREDLASPDRRTVIYRGRRVAPQRRRSFALFATISHWEVEEHEVEIALAQGVVRDVQVRVRRARLPHPDGL